MACTADVVQKARKTLLGSSSGQLDNQWEQSESDESQEQVDGNNTNNCTAQTCVCASNNEDNSRSRIKSADDVRALIATVKNKKVTAWEEEVSATEY